MWLKHNTCAMSPFRLSNTFHPKLSLQTYLWSILVFLTWLLAVACSSPKSSPPPQTQTTKQCRDKPMASCLSLELQPGPGWSPGCWMATALLLLEDTPRGMSSGCLQGLESHCSTWESAAVDFGLALSWPARTRCRYWCSSAEVVYMNLSDVAELGPPKLMPHVTHGPRP